MNDAISGEFSPETEVFEPYIDVVTESQHDDELKLRQWQKIGLAFGGLGLAFSMQPAATADIEAANPETEKAAAPSTIVVETYNILGSGHTGKASAARRFKLSAKIIKGNAGAPTADVVGFQEMSVYQRQLADAQLSGYDGFPDNGRVNNSIFYDKSEFNFIAGGMEEYPSYGDAHEQMTGKGAWLVLEEKDTGKEIAVSNFHAVASSPEPGWDRGGAWKRHKTAQIADNWVEAVIKNLPEAAIFVLGDWNATNVRRLRPTKDTPKVKDTAIDSRRYLPYCVLTNEPKEMQNTRDMLNNNGGRCPENRPLKSWDVVDWVFANPKYVTITNWRLIKNPTAKKASDHFPVVVNAKITN